MVGFLEGEKIPGGGGGGGGEEVPKTWIHGKIIQSNKSGHQQRARIDFFVSIQMNW